MYRLPGTKLVVNNKVLFAVLALFAVCFTVLFVIAFSLLFQWCDAFAKQTASDSPLLHVFLAALCFFVGAGLCWKFAPHAVGNGVLKIRTALGLLDRSDKEVEPYLGGKQLVTKFFASLICSLGGGALGREGPVVHLSAALFWMFGRPLKKMFPTFDLRHWVVGGSAVGLAIAFHSPLAALIFVIEELFDENLAQGRFMTLWLVLLACVFHISFMPFDPYFPFVLGNENWQDIIVLILLTAFISGILATLLMVTSEKAQSLAERHYPFWMVALLCGTAVGVIGVLCGGASFGGGVITLKQALANDQSAIHFKEFAGRMLNTLLSAFSGNAGGLLGPSVALGGSIGSVIGDIFNVADARILMACGMSAFLGGLMSIPLTATILVFETTGQSILILPCFISGMVGYLIAGYTRTFFGKSFRE